MLKPPARTNPLALVADDDLSLRLAMRAALIKAGFDVLEAENGKQAVKLATREHPELVLLDVMMPEMNGFETCAAIRKLPAGEFVQILMVTGLEDIDSIQQAFVAGANDFVSKPINWLMLGYRAKYMLRAGKAFQEVHTHKNRLAKTQQLARLGNWDIDFTTNTFQCSSEASIILGLSGSAAEIEYKDFFSSIIAQERDHVQETLDKAIRARASFNVNYRIVRPDGVQRYILNQGEIIHNDRGEAKAMLGAVQDVSRLKKAEEKIRILAFYDGLTGLANRMLFLDRLILEIEKAKRHNRKLALLFLDLDQFKTINDTLGHHIGDLLLKKVSEILRKSIRASDTLSWSAADENDSLIARFGGDEFTILLNDIIDAEAAAIVARRLLKEMQVPFNLDGNDVSITTSIGISFFPTDGLDADTLLKYADSAMYHAKEKGRNNFQFYKESLNTAINERFSLEQDMRNALERDEFILYYQPQIALSTRKIVGAEALIRWIHPHKGMIPPDKFITIAEESGFIIDINKWVIQAACRENSNWIQAGLDPVRIAVNLSGYQLAQQNIIEVIKDALDEEGLTAEHLEIEITENILMQNVDETNSILNQMRDLHLSLALDDFGTGYSSLSYLTSFPIDTLKIDRSFVMGSTLQKNNLIIIKAIIAMGHSLGMKIVAEGIETEEQLRLMQEYGVDEAQGYYFKAPVPQEEFQALLRKGYL